MNFTHLHVHSYYSEFDGMARVIDIVDKCIATGMNAVALTDHGNMCGIKELQAQMPEGLAEYLNKKYDL